MQRGTGCGSTDSFVAEGTLQNYYVLIFGSMAMVLVLSIAGALCVKERVFLKEKRRKLYIQGIVTVFAV